MPAACSSGFAASKAALHASRVVHALWMPAAIDSSFALHASRALAHAGLAAFTAASVVVVSSVEPLLLQPTTTPTAAITNVTFILFCLIVSSPPEQPDRSEVIQPTSAGTRACDAREVGASAFDGSSKTSRHRIATQMNPRWFLKTRTHVFSEAMTIQEMLGAVLDLERDIENAPRGASELAAIISRIQALHAELDQIRALQGPLVPDASSPPSLEERTTMELSQALDDLAIAARAKQ
jgi:hypothetical protein